MKKFRNYSLLAGAMLTLAFTACSNEEIENVPLEKPVAAQVTADIDQVVTRASGTSWEKDDAIGISCSSTNTSYTNMKYVTASNDGNFAHEGGAESGIFFQGTEDVEFSAYYPFTGTEASAPGTAGAISGNTREQANQKDFDYLYATASTSYATPIISFTGDNIFKHKMTRLILIIETSTSDGFNAEDVKNGTYSLSGIKHQGTFNTSNGTATATETVTNDWEITATATDANNQHIYSMILYPQSSSLTFKAVINSQTYSVEIDPALAASTSYTYTITVKKAGLEVSKCTIQGWGDEITGSGTAAMPTSKVN